MFSGKPDAGNLPVRFEEGRGGSIGLPLSYSPGHLSYFIALVAADGRAGWFVVLSVISSSSKHRQQQELGRANEPGALARFDFSALDDLRRSGPHVRHGESLHLRENVTN